MVTNQRTSVRILVVDDEEFVRECSVDILASAGFEVDAASNGLEALDRIRRTPYDVVVSDVMMPRLDGIELYGRVTREHPKMKDSFIFVTGDRTQAVRVPPSIKLLLKPFRASELINSVRGILGEHVAKRREERYTWMGDCMISIKGAFEPSAVAATVHNISAHGFNVLYRGHPLKADTMVAVRFGEIGLERSATVRWSCDLDDGAAAGLMLTEAVPARLIAGEPWTPSHGD